MKTNGVVVRVSEEETVSLVRAPAADGGDVVAAWLASSDPNTYALEEAFAGVHVLLTGLERGGEGPLGFIANEALGEAVQLAHTRGIVRRFDPATVVAIADAIESLSAKVVRQRLASDALAAVHPFAGRALDDEAKEWLLAVLQGLMIFMRRAATDGAGVLVALR